MLRLLASFLAPKEETLKQSEGSPSLTPIYRSPTSQRGQDLHKVPTAQKPLVNVSTLKLLKKFVIEDHGIPASSVLFRYGTASGGQGYRVVVKDPSFLTTIRETLKSWKGPPVDVVDLHAVTPAE